MGVEHYRHELAVLSGLLAASAALWAKSMPAFSVWLVNVISSFDRTTSLISGYLVYLLINLCMWFVFSLALRSNQKCIITLALNLLSNFGFSVSSLWILLSRVTPQIEGSVWLDIFWWRTNNTLVYRYVFALLRYDCSEFWPIEFLVSLVTGRYLNVLAFVQFHAILYSEFFVGVNVRVWLEILIESFGLVVRCYQVALCPSPMDVRGGGFIYSSPIFLEWSSTSRDDETDNGDKG